MWKRFRRWWSSSKSLNRKGRVIKDRRVSNESVKSWTFKEMLDEMIKDVEVHGNVELMPRQLKTVVDRLSLREVCVWSCRDAIWLPWRGERLVNLVDEKTNWKKLNPLENTDEWKVKREEYEILNRRLDKFWTMIKANEDFGKRMNGNLREKSKLCFKEVNRCWKELCVERGSVGDKDGISPKRKFAICGRWWSVCRRTRVKANYFYEILYSFYGISSILWFLLPVILIS